MGAVISGTLALIADAVHNLSDRFGIGHVTPDTEAPGACGAHPARIGGGASTAPRG